MNELDGIDYEAVSRMLQKELEEARFEILRLRQRPAFRVGGVAEFLARHYMTISAIGVLAYTLFLIIDSIKQIRSYFRAG